MAIDHDSPSERHADLLGGVGDIQRVVAVLIRHGVPESKARVADVRVGEHPNANDRMAEIVPNVTR